MFVVLPRSVLQKHSYILDNEQCPCLLVIPDKEAHMFVWTNCLTDSCWENYDYMRFTLKAVHKCVLCGNIVPQIYVGKIMKFMRMELRIKWKGSLESSNFKGNHGIMNT